MLSSQKMKRFLYAILGLIKTGVRDIIKNNELPEKSF